MSMNMNDDDFGDIDPEVEKRVLQKHGVDTRSAAEREAAALVDIEGANSQEELDSALRKHGMLRED